jgi:hypothetical protein
MGNTRIASSFPDDFRDAIGAASPFRVFLPVERRKYGY